MTDPAALAEPLAAAVLTCPSVAALSGGPFGTVGTYLPGRRVRGIEVDDERVTVRVIARIAPLRTIEAEVRAAVGAVVPGRPVDLAVDDVVTDAELVPTDVASPTRSDVPPAGPARPVSSTSPWR